MTLGDQQYGEQQGTRCTDRYYSVENPHVRIVDRDSKEEQTDCNLSATSAYCVSQFAEIPVLSIEISHFAEDVEVDPTFNAILTDSRVRSAMCFPLP